MLISIVQHKGIDTKTLDGVSSRQVAVGPDQDRNIPENFSHHHRLVASISWVQQSFPAVVHHLHLFIDHSAITSA
jgi:hypothetical protein